jgi:hypothetical protein
VFLAKPVYRKIRRDLAQPEHKVRVGLHLRKPAMELHEHLLRQIFRPVPVAQHAERQAKNRTLVPAHQHGKGPRISGAGPGQRIAKRACLVALHGRASKA